MNTDMTSSPVIEARHLHRRFGLKEAVHDVSFTLHPGTVMALMGRNGAGKTTTLNLLLDLVRPSSGEARIFGRRSDKLRAADRARLGFVSESHGLPLWMTATQLCGFLRPMYPTWDDTFCANLCQLFALPMDRKIGRLSRGEQMKACFVAALSYHPELLVLDEPFSGLDSVVREDVVDALIELMNHDRWAVLVSSHDIDEVERLADELLILDEGRTVLEANAADLTSRSRRVTVTLPAAATFQRPASWLQWQGDGATASFIITQCDDIPAEIARVLPDAVVRAVEGVSLKALYPALLRERPWAEKGESRSPGAAK